jgi:hypothetical protein
MEYWSNGVVDEIITPLLHHSVTLSLHRRLHSVTPPLLVDNEPAEGKQPTSLFGTQTWKSIFQRSSGQRAAKKWQPNGSALKSVC